VLENVQN